MNFYNDIDPDVCAWTQELIADGLIAPGTVACKSIADITPDELKDYTQVHFFNGISGWARALDLAGWPRTRPVWCASCPCQPFSCAGQGRGTADERHLWPELFRLIQACKPEIVIGEQVASAEVLGSDLEAAFVDAVQRGDHAKANKFANRLVKCPSLGFEFRWLDGIQADLETASYTIWASDLPCASVGAPHIRQRLWWYASRLANAELARREETGSGPGIHAGSEPEPGIAPRGMGDVLQQGLEGHAGYGHDGDQPGRHGADAPRPVAETSRNGWSDWAWHRCTDGKHRRVPSFEPDLQQLFNGFSGILGDRWAESVLEIERKIATYAETAKIGPLEALRAVWMRTAQEALQRENGGYDEVYIAEVLLVALLRCARNPLSIVWPATFDFQSLCEATMRVLWKDEISARSSHQPGLERSSSGEPEDTVRGVPYGYTSPKAKTLQDMRPPFPPSRHVPETLPAVEEIWRPIFNQAARFDNKKIRACHGLIGCITGYPLAPALKGRTMLLKGYGNSICPELAAVFIKSLL